MADELNDFGDRRLVNIELVPVAANQRVLGWRQLAPLWAAVGMSPGLYGVACGQLPVAPALLAVALGLTAAAVMGGALSGSAARFGVGFVPQCRAAFGARGALVPTLVRWLVGVVWLGVWAHQLGQAMVGMALGLGPSTTLQTPVAQDVAGWGAAAALIISAWLVARGGMSRVTWVALVSVLAAVLVAFALVVFAGIASEGFGPWFGRSQPWTGTDLLGVVARVVAMALPAVVVCGDWQRFSRGRIGAPLVQRSLLDTLVPAAVVPVGVIISFVGALLASASFALRREVAGEAIADAAGFGGMPAALLAVVLVGFLWLGAAPIVGMYSSALAACGLAPRRVSYHGGLAITAVGAVAVVPLSSVATSAGVGVTTVAGSLAAILGILLVDELVIRRRRMILEELYLFSRHYGPIASVAVSAVVALLLGWLLHAEILPLWAAALPASVRQTTDQLAQVPPEVLTVPGAALVAGLVYVLCAPLERLLFGRDKTRRKKRKIRKKRKRDRRPQPIDHAETAGLTNPFFVSSEKGDSDSSPLTADAVARDANRNLEDWGDPDPGDQS